MQEMANRKGAIVAFVASNIPAGASFSCVSGELGRRDSNAPVGRNSIQIAAHDGVENSPLAELTIDVVDPPPPVLPTPQGGGSITSLWLISWFLLALRKRQRRFSWA